MAEGATVEASGACLAESNLMTRGKTIEAFASEFLGHRATNGK
jgi:hypothetical protein